jgi:hypothetical protein
LRFARHDTGTCAAIRMTMSSFGRVTESVP